MTLVGTRVVDMLILSAVLAWEGIKVAKWVLGWKMVRVWMDLVLQAAFVAIMSVLLLNVSVVSMVAGSVRKRSLRNGSRHQAMAQLQKTSFDFLHKAICCVSFWVCQMDIGDTSAGRNPKTTEIFSALSGATLNQVDISPRMGTSAKELRSAAAKGERCTSYDEKESSLDDDKEWEDLSDISKDSYFGKSCDEYLPTAAEVGDQCLRRTCSDTIMTTKNRMMNMAEKEMKDTILAYKKAKSVVTQQYVWNMVDRAIESTMPSGV